MGEAGGKCERLDISQNFSRETRTRGKVLEISVYILG